MRTQFFLFLFISVISVWLFVSSVINPTVRIPIIVCVLMVMLLCLNLVRLSWKELTARAKKRDHLKMRISEIKKETAEQKKLYETLLEENLELKKSCK